MDRDFRLTGAWREQTDKPIAPVGFEVNNPWRVCRSLLRSRPSLSFTDGKKDHLNLCRTLPPTVHIFLVTTERINFYSARLLCND